MKKASLLHTTLVFLVGLSIIAAEPAEPALAQVALAPKAMMHAVFNETSQLAELRWAGLHKKMHEKAALHLLSGKKLMMMGDSLTRYQYLNLVHLLEHGAWPHKESGMCNKKKFGSWSGFLSQTNAAFRGREICDCYRGKVLFENRRYYNPKLQTTVWFVQWFGDKLPPRGHVRLMDPHVGNYDANDGSLPCMPASCNSTNDAWTMSPAKFLEEFVVNHRPDVFLLNSGHHKLYDARSISTSQVAKELLQVLSRYRRDHQAGAPTRVVWKTTTPLLVNSTLLFKHDEAAHKLQEDGLLELFDAAAVVKLLFEVFSQRVSTPGSFTWDQLHYQCWVHTELNLAMIRQLFGQGRTKHDRHKNALLR